MHWRRITAKRVRQRGGRPRPRPVMETKPDWQVTSIPCPVPSQQPSVYSTDINSIVSEAFKERPRPRKPEYLRESFDVTQITTEKNLLPSAPSTRVTTKDDDETKPRLTQPQPCYQTRNNIHPYQRNPREESIVFPSSSGEESFVVAEAPKETGKDTYGKKPQHVLLLWGFFFFLVFFSF